MKKKRKEGKGRKGFLRPTGFVKHCLESFGSSPVGAARHQCNVF